MRVLWWFALLGVLAGCAGNSDPLVLTSADSTNEVLVDAGEEFEVRLESNPSTGYAWEISSGSAVAAVRLLSREYIAPDSDLVGAAGEEVFVFVALADADILRLEYIRPFDDPVIPERIVEFIIRVDGAPWPPEDVDAPSTTSVSAAMEVSELLKLQAGSPAIVAGYVIWDTTADARLCEVIMESFPPQCGGPYVVITNPETLDLTLQQEQSIRWSDDRPSLSGVFDGERLTLDP